MKTQGGPGVANRGPKEQTIVQDKKKKPASPRPAHKAFRFCPICGSKSADVGSNPFFCINDECHYRYFFTPFSAVGALIVDPAGDMLFIVRGKDPGKGRLGLPGGFIDAGETAETALVREVEEELNLSIIEYQYLASFPNKYAYAGVISAVTDLFFVSWVESFAPIRVQEGEVDAWKFVSPSRIRKTDLAFESHFKAIQAYRK